MKLLRTPEERFANLPGYPFEPNYVEVPSGQGGTIRIHHVDEGPKDANPVLMMHGEPSWSYLYRKMIPIIVDAGYRAVAPDLVGFGRSDKPADRADYTYQHHVDWMKAWLEAVDLKEITLVCQDWGGLIGLRLLTDNPGRFARVIAANTGLPKGEGITQAFLDWRKFSIETPEFDVGGIIDMATVTSLSDEVLAAYNAPFPDDTYKAGARIFPSLVPVEPDNPAVPANQKAWEVLAAFQKPFLTAFSDSDEITRGGELIFQDGVAGAVGQPHTTIKGGGHFLQEDCGEALADVVVDFMS